MKKISLKNSIFLAISSVVISFVTLIIAANLLITQKSTINFSITQSKEISNQMIKNYDNYFNSLIETFSYLELETSNPNEKKDIKKIYDIINESSKDIISISLYNLDEQQIISTGLKGNINEKFLEKIKENETYHNFSSPYNVEDSTAIQIGKKIKFYDNDILKDGILIIENNFTSIVNLAKSVNLGKNGYLMFVDNNYNLIFSSNSNVCSTEKCDGLKMTENIIIGIDIIDMSSEKFVAAVQTISNTRWRIAIFNNVQDFFNTGFINNIIIVSISAIALIASLIISYILGRKVSNPIKNLQIAMEKVEKGDFLVQVDNSNKRGQIEIINLTNSFNSMVIKIDDLMKSVIKEQKAKRKSELKALQNQINPHFLYNTLDSIVFLAESKKNEEVEQMVVALARLFRISISKGKNIITIQEEIEHVKNYLIIQTIRYKNEFTYSFEIEDGLNDFKTMKLILQPFVENSIYHGLKNLDDIGHIIIKVYSDDKYIYFDITDNGLGMKQNKIEEVMDNMKNPEIKNSVGIKNVYQRLKLYYGDDADVKIESELDEYTIIKIKIPKEMEERVDEKK